MTPEDYERALAKVQLIVESRGPDAEATLWDICQALFDVGVWLERA